MLPPDLVAKLSQCAANDSVGPRDSWFNWLARFTTMVAVGLVLELPELAYELKLIARAWIPYFRYRIYTPPERRLHTAKVVAFAGWIFIVAGVVGERYAEVRVKDFDASIQECSDAKVRQATIESGDAQASAKSAADEAARAKNEADQVTGIAKAARSTADDARVGATAAERQVDGVRSEAGSLKTELDAEKEDLRQIRAARYIPDTANFISAMRPLAGTKYLFWTVAQDADSLRIAILLNSLLKTSGWIKLPLPQQKEHDPLAMNIFQVSNPAEYIPPERFSAGIRIFISSPVVAEGEQRSLASLWKVWGDNPPSSAKPAEALARELTDKLLPHEKTDWGGVSDEEKALGYRPFQVMVVSGNENDADVIAISVGAKPL